MINRSHSQQSKLFHSRFAEKSPVISPRFTTQRFQEDVRRSYFSPLKPISYKKPVYRQVPSSNYFQYIPYQRSKIEYQIKEYTDQVPIEKKVIDYRPVKKIDYLPKERTVIDYYQIQHQTNYVPMIIPQKKIDYIPIQTVNQRIQYFPYQKQIVHYPSTITSESQQFNRRLVSQVQMNSKKYQTPIKNRMTQQQITSEKRINQQTYDTYPSKRNLSESRASNNHENLNIIKQNE